MAGGHYGKTKKNVVVRFDEGVHVVKMLTSW